MRSKKPGPGAVIEIGFPFVLVEREGKTLPEADFERSPWRPGTRDHHTAPDDFERVADGFGSMIFTIVSTHKPPGWPERVLYTRAWRDPDGREFSRRKLHVTTRAYFTQLCRGYRHDFGMMDDAGRITRRHEIPATKLLEHVT